MTKLKDSVSTSNSSAVWARNPDGSWRDVYQNGAQDKHLAASHIKLILAERLNDMVARGKISLNKVITSTKDIIADDIEDAGFGKPMQAGQQMTVKDALDRTLKYSANTTQNMLLKEMYSNYFTEAAAKFPTDAGKAQEYAFNAISAEWKQAGYKDTEIHKFLNLRDGHKLADLHKNATPLSAASNKTTVNDVGLAMKQIWGASTSETVKVTQNALGNAFEQVDPNYSLGEKVSGTSKVTAHAGAYNQNGTTYISVGFIDKGRTDGLSGYKPFVSEAKDIITQDKNLSKQQSASATIKPNSQVNTTTTTVPQPNAEAKPVERNLLDRGAGWIGRQWNGFMNMLTGKSSQPNTSSSPSTTLSSNPATTVGNIVTAAAGGTAVAATPPATTSPAPSTVVTTPAPTTPTSKPAEPSPLSGLMDSFKSAGREIKNFGRGIKNGVVGAFNGTTEAVSKTANETGEFLGMATDQNKKLWQEVDPKVAATIKDMSPEQLKNFNEVRHPPMADGVSVSLAATAFSGVMGGYKEGAGWDRVSMVIYNNIKDLKEMGGAGAIPAVAGTALQKIGSAITGAISKAWSALTDPNEKDFGKKIGNTFAAMGTGFTEGFKSLNPESVIKSTIEYRAEKIKQELTAMGYDEKFTSFMYKNVIKNGIDAVKKASPIPLFTEEGKTQAAPSAPAPNVAQNPAPAAVTPASPSQAKQSVSTTTVSAPLPTPVTPAKVSGLVAAGV
jgi:beta-lactamase class A